jgi:shikimate dehydrogenase
MTRLGVIGWPVAHSRSPAMFAAAFAACGMSDWTYQRLPIAPELFDQTVRVLGASGFHGANVTIPHKQAALALADSASDAARAIGAANTLSFAADGAIAAENTDAPGLLAAIGEPVAGKRALVLGAGGSARAAVWALLGAGAAEVSVWNRTPERAVALARDLGARAVATPAPADLLVNCTSVGLQRTATEAEALNQLALRADQVGSYACVVDLVYGEHPTPLLAAASAAGARIVDGLDVLVAQGALSFQLWSGREPPLAAMRAGARAQPA